MTHILFDRTCCSALAQVEELHAKLQPHLLRRLKRDVLGALPPKKEQIVRVELAPPQRALYKATLTSQFDVLTAGEGFLIWYAVQLRNVLAVPDVLP